MVVREFSEGLQTDLVEILQALQVIRDRLRRIQNHHRRGPVEAYVRSSFGSVFQVIFLYMLRVLNYL